MSKLMERKQSNVAQSFLQQTDEQNPLALFLAYADYLLDSSSCLTLPISLEQIRQQHGLRLKKAPLPQRGFLFEDVIFVNTDDRETVQLFSQAHELMETLVVALRGETPQRFTAAVWKTFNTDKEQWCERGAAALLMPAKLFFPLVQTSGVSFQSGQQLANLCGTSLIATMRRILDANTTSCIFVLLKEGYKKNEYVPSQVGQGVLWDDPTDWDPPAELRVSKCWSSPQVNLFLCWNESISRQTTIYKTLTTNIVGQISKGQDLLDLQYIKGLYRTESKLVTIENNRVVMALIHL